MVVHTTDTARPQDSLALHLRHICKGLLPPQSCHMFLDVLGDVRVVLVNALCIQFFTGGNVQSDDRNRSNFQVQLLSVVPIWGAVLQ